jgi:hypothetical protein
MKALKLENFSRGQPFCRQRFGDFVKLRKTGVTCYF